MRAWCMGPRAKTRWIHASGTRSGKRNPDRPNWRQVLKAKEAEKERKKELAKQNRREKKDANEKELKEMKDVADAVYFRKWGLSIIGAAFLGGFVACEHGNDCLVAFQEFCRKNSINLAMFREGYVRQVIGGGFFVRLRRPIGEDDAAHEVPGYTDAPPNWRQIGKPKKKEKERKKELANEKRRDWRREEAVYPPYDEAMRAWGYTPVLAGGVYSPVVAG